MSSKQFLEHIIDLLSRFSEVKYKSMFGGYGIYKNGIIIALILKDELYFKSACYQSTSYFESFGAEKFYYYNKNNKKINMPYWKIPSNILEDEEGLKRWVEISYASVIKQSN